MFKTTDNLMHHVRVHAATKECSCRHCSESFRWHHQLKSHLLKSHNEGTWFTCHICQKKFSHKCDLKEHIRRHEGVKPYVCDECSKCFCTARDMRQHQVVHSDVKKFCCGFCGKDFKRPRGVKEHYRRCRDVTEFDDML